MSTKLIIDKQNSGKSLRAEGLAVSCGKPLYYLATMKVMDEDGRRHILKYHTEKIKMVNPIKFIEDMEV